MKWCNECKRIVDTTYEREFHLHDEIAEFGYVPVEERSCEVCEECGSDDLSTAGECVMCGCEIDPDEEWCEDCYLEVTQLLEDAANVVSARLNEMRQPAELRDSLFLLGEALDKMWKEVE